MHVEPNNDSINNAAANTPLKPTAQHLCTQEVSWDAAAEKIADWIFYTASVAQCPLKLCRCNGDYPAEKVVVPVNASSMKSSASQSPSQNPFTCPIHKSRGREIIIDIVESWRRSNV